MAERRKIGIIYRYDENWIGGTYYIQNLISALNRLPASEMFELLVFAEDENEFTNLKSFTRYPYLSRGSYVVKLPVLKRILNRISRAIGDKNMFSVFNRNIDLVFPADYTGRFKKDQCFLYWIPDFQEFYLPAFFSSKELERRRKKQTEIVNKGSNIVFSSQSAKSDFNEIYPSNHLKQFVLNFAVTHPVLTDLNYVKNKFNLPDRFYICCNQFWKHKNHITVIKAIQLMKQQGHMPFVVFTGKEHDDRHPEFFDELMENVNSLGVKDCVAFLGFISREDQLCLMKESIAIVQPSLFEGWSTVIEDAKSLKARIVASDISVHREQLKKYNAYAMFEAGNECELAKAILTINEVIAIAPDYEKDIVDFALNFKMIVDRITNK